MDLKTIYQSVSDWRVHILALSDSKRVRMIVFVIALLGFAAGLWVSIYKVDFPDTQFNWVFFWLLAFFGVPLGITLNAVGFQISSSAVGRVSSLGGALRVTIVSSMANFLPVPAGPVIRATALYAHGATYSAAAKITAAVALYWVSVALIVAGAGLGYIVRHLGFLVLGLIGLTAGSLAVIMTRSVCGSSGIVFRFCGLAIVMHLTATLNIWLAFKMIGLDVNVVESTIVASSGTAGALVGIVPGGLGLNEGIAALIAGSIGIAASAGFVVVALNRVISYAVSLPFAIVLISTGKGTDPGASKEGG